MGYLITEQTPVYLVLLPLISAFLIPFIRGVEEFIQGSISLFIYRYEKILIFTFLAVETVLTWRFIWLRSSETTPLISTFGGWSTKIGISFLADELSLWFLGMINLGMLVVTFYSINYMTFNESRFQTLLPILRASVIGLIFSWDFFNLYLFVELISISSSALIAFMLKPRALWGAFQYLIFNTLAGLLIFLGISLLYSQLGQLNLTLVKTQLESSGYNPVTLWAVAIIMLGGAVKIALAPFHLWLPPAHGDAEIPVSALLSGVILKVNFYFVFRLYLDIFPYHQLFYNGLLILAGLSIVSGHWGALKSTSPKQILANSSIVNMGYASLALGLGGPWQITATLAILVQHFLGKTFAFLSLGIFFSNKPGFIYRLISSIMLASIFSLISLPPFPGFWGKWLLLKSSLATGHIWMFVLVIISIFPTLIYYRKFYNEISDVDFGSGSVIRWGKKTAMFSFWFMVVGFYFLLIKYLGW